MPRVKRLGPEHRCRTCKKYRGGLLRPFEGHYYCEPHWRECLDWHETRGNLVLAIQTGLLGASVTQVAPPPDRPAALHRIRRSCDRATFALAYGRPAHEFVRPFIDAMVAWQEIS